MQTEKLMVKNWRFLPKKIPAVIDFRNRNLKKDLKYSYFTTLYRLATSSQLITLKKAVM